MLVVNPINLLIYKCYECTLYYYNDCQIKEGLNHPHPLLKLKINERLKKWIIFYKKFFNH